MRGHVLAADRNIVRRSRYTLDAALPRGSLNLRPDNFALHRPRENGSTPTFPYGRILRRDQSEPSSPPASDIDRLLSYPRARSFFDLDVFDNYENSYENVYTVRTLFDIIFLFSLNVCNFLPR